MSKFEKQHVLEKKLIEFNQLYSFSNGLLVLPPGQLPNNTLLLNESICEQGSKYALALPAPTTLYPTPFPRSLFKEACEVQETFNLLVDGISKDSEFLLSTLEAVSKVDEFLSQLLVIYKETLISSKNQTKRLGILRSDYLLHQVDDIKEVDGQDLEAIKELFDSKKLRLYQVELNTIASSFGSLASLTTNLHQFLASKTDGFYGRLPITNNNASLNLPNNEALTNISAGLANAHNLYGVPSSTLFAWFTKYISASVLFVVQPDERNVFDQRHLELILFQSHNIHVIRKTLTDIQTQARLDKDNRLFLEDNEISVVYFRAGYAPTDYPSQLEWDARALIERSWSIKCPNIAYHLAGSKKIQQVLAQPGILEKFLDSEKAELARNYFTGLYPLDSSSHGKDAYKRVLQYPKGFVLKPSREGGGNNLYDEEIVPFLDSLPEASREAYILMDRILPPRFIDNNVGLRFGQPSLRGNFVSELGIYGVFIADDNQVYSNSVAGHLLRTKLESSNEGGVAVGHSVIDSPFLIGE